ncbi:hypothetical protein B0H13DRAFT_1650268 [Mycena leptocephala]|nr:hypothetical protein B0H13DRAFT_1650268 [Mycena leptocephala]
MHGSQLIIWTAPPLGCANSKDADRVGVQVLYNAGVPFFTKEAIQDVKEDGTTDDHVFIPALDGNKVEFPVNKGQLVENYTFMWKSVPEKQELVIGKPYLGYHTIPNLANGEHHTDDSVVYLPYQLIHETFWRHTETKERVSSFPSPTDEETNLLFHRLKIEFEASDDFREISSVMKSPAIPSGIRKIVAFACGSPSAGPGCIPCVMQHILVLALKDMLSGKNGNAAVIQCLAQDPIHSDMDKQLLGKHGITVLDDPRGFLQLDESSIVISITPNIPVKQIVTDLARPAVIIWSSISGDPIYSTAQWTDPESPRLLDMTRKEYTKFEFPNYKDSFDPAAIYARKPRNSDCEL